MPARFAESCRTEFLELDPKEGVIQTRCADEPSCLTCEEDIFLGFFFDGTNNNKYRDTPDYCHSNIARLYEAYPGKATMGQLALRSGEGKPDEPYLKGPGTDQNLYRKTYIPGVGTPFKNLDDSGEDSDETLGLGMAWHAEVRICWALLQVTNHICAALRGENLSPPLEDDGKLAQKMLTYWHSERKPLPLTIPFRPYQTKPELWITVPNPRADRATILAQRSQALNEKIKIRLNNKPSLRRVRISVFGFSRGAAEARVFTNWLLNAYGGGVGGIALSVDFLGIFDTVASVGIPFSVPGADGHYSWASAENLHVSSVVKRCAHLVAAHEVRASFPLDSVGSGPNVKEVVYPGVHSDVGGGYLPEDQGRAQGKGSKGDQKKISQIALAQMYREALMAGVPMTNPDEWKGFRASNFNIDSDTINKFNAYVRVTSQPAKATSKPGPVTKASLAAINPMWPSELQPPVPLRQLMHQHYGYFLQWRRAILGSAHKQASLTSSAAKSKAQDIADFNVTDQLLKQEVEFLQDKSPRKYLTSDDSKIEQILTVTYVASATVSVLVRSSVVGVMQNKQREWDQEIKTVWAGSCPEPCVPFFETLMHDSRAWFKPTIPDAKKETQEEIRKLQRENKSLQQANEMVLLNPDAQRRAGASESEVQALMKKNKAKIEENNKIIEEYKTGRRIRLALEGHEPYRMYGYLRWRHIFSGQG